MAHSNRLDGVVVLIVDDNDDARELLQIVLRGHGAIVVTAESALQALGIIGREVPDVLLSDVGMPEMDGIELIKFIRSAESEKKLVAGAGAHLPAVAISAFSTAADREKCLAAGFGWHIAKPFEAGEVIATVESLIGRRRTGDALH